MNGFELGGDSMENHRFLFSLMDASAVDWRAIDVWLGDNVEKF